MAAPRRKKTGAADTHALQRSISKLAIGVVRDVDKIARRDRDNKLGERVEEFQIKVSGTAADLPVWQRGDLDFEIGYTKGSGQRASDLLRPQVYVGFEQSHGKSESSTELVPVFATLVVVAWETNDYDLIDGCTFACAAIAPGDQVDFQGFFHLSIAGWGAPLEDRDTGD